MQAHNRNDQRGPGHHAWGGTWWCHRRSANERIQTDLVTPRQNMLDTCLRPAMVAIMSSRGVLPPPEGDERLRPVSDSLILTRRWRWVRGLRGRWGWRGSARARSAGSAPSWTRG